MVRAQKTSKRRYWRIASVGLGLILALLLAGYEWGLPWLALREISTVLREAGIPIAHAKVGSITLRRTSFSDLIAGQDQRLRIRDIGVEYHLGGLLHGRVEKIFIDGAELQVDVVDGRLELGSLGNVLHQNRQGNQPSKSLPLDRIELASSSIIVRAGDHQVTLPIQGILTNNAGHYDVLFKAEVAQQPLTISAKIEGHAVRIKADGKSIDLNALEGAVRDLSLPRVKLTGKLDAHAELALDDGAGSISATIRPHNSVIATKAGTNLQLTSGVLNYVRTIASATSSSGLIGIKDLAISSDTAAAWAEGINGTITFNGLSPLLTAPNQHLTITSMGSGQLQLTGGEIDFEAQKDGRVFIQNTRWHGLAGTLSAHDFWIDPANIATAFTLDLQDVALKDLLDAFGEGHASGSGLVSGAIPVRLEGSKFALGEGKLVADRSGTLQISDAAELAKTLATGDPRFAAGGPYADLREDLAQAMSDFEFQTLRTDLIKGDNGLTADIHLAGHGRRGTRRAYDFEFRVSDVNKVVALSMGLRNAFSGK